MSAVKCKLKSGMAGSRNGRNRWDYTEVLKKSSKKRRRRFDKEIIRRNKNGL